MPGRIQLDELRPSGSIGDPRHGTLIHSGWKWPLLLAILLSVPAAFTAYFRSFAGMQPYDDEGGLSEMVRAFLSGRPLYDSVPSIYGPAYFFYEWMAHTFSGQPVTTDSVRFVSIAFWLASAILVLLLAWRATGSWMIAAGAYLLAFRVLSFIGADPAHPQELCIFLALALLFAGCFPGNRVAVMLWLGVLAGVSVLTKINMGALVMVALALAFVQAIGTTRIGNLARIAVAAGALAFPLILMSPTLAMPWAQRYCAFEELSLMAMLIALARRPSGVRFRVREPAICGAGLLAAAVALASFAIGRGSTAAAMIEWLIVRPRASFGLAWYWPPQIGAAAVWWAALGFVAALLAALFRALPVRITRAADITAIIAVAKLALGVIVLALAVSNRVEQIMYVAPPWIWLVVMPHAAQQRLGPFSRGLLGAMGVVIVLYAYPVAGAQIPFVVVFLIVVAAVAFGDGVDWLADRVPRVKLWGRPVAFAVTVLAVLRFCVITPARARQYYDGLQPVGLPGASRLHLEASDAAGLREVVMLARSTCAMLITVPGMPTFNFWTGLPAPHGLLAGNWVTGLDDPAQQRILAGVAKQERLCVLYNADQIAMWTHDADVSGRPIIKFINENFRSIGTGRGNVLMIRR